MTNEAGSRGRPAAVLAAAGGSLAAIGSVYDWASVSGRKGSVVATGADLFGPFTVAAGLTAVIAGMLLLVVGGMRARAILGVLILASGVVVAGLGLYVATSERVVIDALSEDRGSPRAARRAEVVPQPGLFVVIAGGALVMAGGVGGLLSARARVRPATGPADVVEPAEGTPDEGPGA